MATAPDLTIENKILQALAERPLNRPEIVVQTGYSHEEVAGALFRMRNKHYFRLQDLQQNSNYVLTETGRRAVPPKYIRDLAKFFPPKDQGHKHIVGVAGKFDYAAPLRGGMALIYDALTRPMTYGEISEAANMDNKAVSPYLQKLVKLEIVKEVDTKEGKRFARARDMRTLEIAEPPKPVLTPADPKHPIIEKIVSANQPNYAISSFSKANIPLDEAIDELLARFSPMEIMICCLARFEIEHKRLTDFEREILSHINKE